MEQLIEEILIWCTLCKKQTKLEDALLNGWKYCNVCYHFTCNDCAKDSNNNCLSDICRSQVKKPILGAIPVEKIVLYSKTMDSAVTDIDRDSLIFKIFYYEEFVKNTPFEILRRKAEGDIKTTEEIWRDHRIIVVRRKHGKFDSWERIV